MTLSCALVWEALVSRHPLVPAAQAGWPADLWDCVMDGRPLPHQDLTLAYSLAALASGSLLHILGHWALTLDTRTAPVNVMPRDRESRAYDRWPSVPFMMLLSPH